MMKTEDVSETPTKSIADEVSDAVGNLATIALSSGGDLESGGGDEGETTVTNTLIKSVAKSMVNKVSAENSISFARRTATYCWSKISSNLTKQNLIDTFGANILVLLSVCLLCPLWLYINANPINYNMLHEQTADRNIRLHLFKMYIQDAMAP